MKIACVSRYDATAKKGWSTRGYYQAQSLASQGIEIEYFQFCRELPFSLLFRLRSIYHQLHHQYYISGPDPSLLKHYAHELSKQLSKADIDLVFAPIGGPSWKFEPIAYLKCDQPIVFWTDAPFIGHMEGFKFSSFYNKVSKEFIRDALADERSILSRSRLAIYTSEWAAQTAIKNYHNSNVKIVPFGPYLEQNATVEDIKKSINSRSPHECKLLFVGQSWHVKGGSLALKVAQELNKRGLKTTLTVVGCQPDEPLPSFVRSIGIVDSLTRNKLYSESHFFIMPSLFEPFGVVFAEASSFGVPSLATNVGGIPSAVKDGLNGKIFQPDAPNTDYCDYVLGLFSNFNDYRELALSSFNEYRSRLNWSTAGQTVKKLMTQLIK